MSKKANIGGSDNFIGKILREAAHNAGFETESTPLPLEEVDYFGGCPVCHRNDGYRNAGRTHIFFCREHQTRWIVGSNLFSNWRDETKESQEAEYNKIGLGEFEEVEPVINPSYFEGGELHGKAHSISVPK